jgi:hypothetical protein
MPYRPLPEPIDRSRIELVEDHELRFWTRELQCSAEHLLGHPERHAALNAFSENTLP